MEDEAAKLVRYGIHHINVNGVLVGREKIHNYVKE
jgi:hypothetical protein